MANWQFPGGATVAVITSWSGGPATDRITYEMLDKYGYKGTFFVRPEQIGTAGFLDAETLRRIAETGHEVGCYGPDNPAALTPADFQKQICESKAHLEALSGREVIAFSYPDGFTEVEAWMTEAVQAAGFTYVRTGAVSDLMTADALAVKGVTQIPVTAHYLADFMEVQTKWLDAEESDGGVFHLWGQTKGMGPEPLDWVDVECNLGFLGGISHVWYPTIGELMAFVRGCRV